MSWRPFDNWSYSYLLGLYLGDGSVIRHARAERLVITLDGIYPEIIKDAVACARSSTRIRSSSSAA